MTIDLQQALDAMTRERDGLAAQCEELRGMLTDIVEREPTSSDMNMVRSCVFCNSDEVYTWGEGRGPHFEQPHTDDCEIVLARVVLARTPAASLAAHDAALWREAERQANAEIDETPVGASADYLEGRDDGITKVKWRCGAKARELEARTKGGDK